MSDRVRTIVAEVLGVDEREVDEDTSAVTLAEWDSLRHMNLVVALEEELGVRFDDDVVTKITSVAAIREALAQARRAA